MTTTAYERAAAKAQRLQRELNEVRAENVALHARLEAAESRVARAMYSRVMVETRDEWPLFEYLPESAQRNWLTDARAALDGEGNQ